MKSKGSMMNITVLIMTLESLVNKLRRKLIIDKRMSLFKSQTVKLKSIISKAHASLTNGFSLCIAESFGM
jgi:hypothetical protein